jgi:DNA invertase Pin-like site-specific DNA recombinase
LGDSRLNQPSAIYLRVSTDEQTTENQERALREVAVRSGHEIVVVYRDEGISGSKGRDKRPGFDAMHKDASRRKFDMVMAWSVDRLATKSGSNALPLRAARYGGKLVMPAELQRIHRIILDGAEVEIISDEMRAVVESLWP